jgi:hypothetical protein
MWPKREKLYRVISISTVFPMGYIFSDSILFIALMRDRDKTPCGAIKNRGYVLVLASCSGVALLKQFCAEKKNAVAY